MVATSEGQDAIQRDLENLERWTHGNLSGVTRPSIRCCTWVGSIPNISTGWGMNRSREDWEGLVGAGGWEAPHELAMWPCNSESQLCSGLHPRQQNQQVNKSYSGPLLPSHESPHAMLHPALGSWAQDGCWTVRVLPPRWLERRNTSHIRKGQEIWVCPTCKNEGTGMTWLQPSSTWRQPTKIEGFFLQDNVVRGQVGMLSNWKRVGLDNIIGRNSWLWGWWDRLEQAAQRSCGLTSTRGV